MTPNQNSPDLSPGLLPRVGLVSLGLIMIAFFSFMTDDAKLTQVGVGVAIVLALLIGFVAYGAAKLRLGQPE